MMPPVKELRAITTTRNGNIATRDHRYSETAPSAMTPSRQAKWLDLAHVSDKNYNDMKGKKKVTSDKSAQDDDSPLEKYTKTLKTEAIKCRHHQYATAQQEAPDSPRKMLKLAAHVDSRYKGLENSIKRLENKFTDLASNMGKEFNEWKTESYGKITDTEHLNTHYFDTLLQQVVANVNEIETLRAEVDHQNAFITQTERENKKLREELERVTMERDNEILERLRCEGELKRVKSSIQALVRPVNEETRVTAL